MQAKFFNCPVSKGNIAACIYHQNASGVPIIVVSGGPGLPYGYLENIAALLPDNPVIFYDAIGVGSSTPVENQHDWHLVNFIEEINALRRSIDLNRFVLLSHSAGTIIAVEYAIAHSHYLDGLIFISPVISTKLYKANLQNLIMQFPCDIQHTLNAMAMNKNVDAVAIMESMAHFTERHVFCKSDWPDALLTASMQINTKMRDYLWGKNDFSLTGTWCDYDRLNALNLISVPTLISCGQHDFIDEKSCREYTKRMPNAIFQLLNQVSHNPHLEDSAQFQQMISNWFSFH